jgi:hypothetical protein
MSGNTGDSSNSFAQWICAGKLAICTDTEQELSSDDEQERR